ncbi:MAG: cytochrome C oxidase subunit IV family protein [Candidatus Acidiferrales bacterium]
MASDHDPGMTTYVGIWVGLLAIVGIEVAVTYSRPETKELLAILLILALIEAAIGLLYFMHMKYERKILFWTLVPITLFVLVMMDHVWADAFRLFRLRLLQ